MNRRRVSLTPAFLSLLLILALGFSACVAIEPEVVPEVGEVEGEQAEGEAAGEAADIAVTEAVTETDVMTGTEAETGADMPGSEAGEPVGLAGIEPGTLVRGYGLMGWDFENLDGQVSGEIKDFFFDMSTGRIPFVTIEYGGVLDIGDKEIAVPLNAFAVGSEGELILNFEEQTLENFPDLGDDWPDVTDPGWDDEVIAFWNDIGIDPGPNIEEVSGPIVRASDLTGFAIVDLGPGAGTIQDTLVDLAAGRVEYLLVGFGAGAPAADDPYILPLAIFDVEEFDTGLGDELVFDAEVTEEMLITAPRFDRALYDDTQVIEPSLSEEIEAYWQEFGY